MVDRPWRGKHRNKESSEVFTAIVPVRHDGSRQNGSSGEVRSGHNLDIL